MSAAPQNHSGSSSPPPLGDYTIDADRTCSRFLGRNADGKERLCGQAAVVHVDWGEASGFVCAEHRGDLGRWSYNDSHEIGGNCGMPGTMWYWAVWEGKRTSWCGVPGDGTDVAEPARAVAVEVAV